MCPAKGLACNNEFSTTFHAFVIQSKIKYGNTPKKNLARHSLHINLKKNPYKRLSTEKEKK